LNQNDIIQYARETLGTPYKHQGRINGMALDCIGVAIYVAQKLGVEYLDLHAYGASPHKGLLEDMMDAQPCLERVHDRQPGDVLQMRFAIEPQHVAIWTGGTIIHCSRDTGRVVECRLDDQMQAKVTKVYRFKYPLPAEGKGQCEG
jgi:cell wall-associated NlpC family hydrolase